MVELFKRDCDRVTGGDGETLLKSDSCAHQKIELSAVQGRVMTEGRHVRL